MSRWFRFYDDAINDPKILKLSDKSYRIWVGLLCLASKNEGRLPLFEDMAIMLRMKPEKLQPEIEILITSGLIDHDDSGMRPHNWEGRQYKTDSSDPTAASRAKKYRDKKRDERDASRCDYSDASVAHKRPETDNRTEQKTEKKDADAARPPPENLETQFYRRTKEICGQSAGGLAKQLLKSKQGSIELARAAVEQAATKENPREYIGGIIKNGTGPPSERPDRSW